ncbi:MAG TPA: hypothetical protein VH087_18420 [Thermoanaerobaculia bacterium]|nr:hypothetical protein [Thermoanaerobaculia bacterium]
MELDIFGSDDVRVSMIDVAAQTLALKLASTEMRSASPAGRS